MLAQERRESFTTRALRSGQALILEYDNMTDPTRKSWMRRGVEGAVRSAFMKAYSTVKVNPEKYLEHLRMAYDLPASTYEGMYSVDPDRKSTRLNSSHLGISYAVFCLKKKNNHLSTGEHTTAL